MRISELSIKLDDKILVDIDFEIDSSLALIGESGSGKSLTLKALLGMLPNSMELSLKKDCEFEFINGKTVAFVPQNPFTALSSMTKIKKQFFSSDERVDELFDEVGLDKALLERFPPELSGGQLQRVIIATALEFHPKLLLLDEPTTALDSKSQDLILKLLKTLQKKEGFRMLFVTHDILSVKKVCEDVAVMYRGKIVESGKIESVVSNPKERYTKTLVDVNFANRTFRK